MSDREENGVEQIVGIKQGQEAWAREAMRVLLEIASRYNASIAYSDLAEEIQRRTGLRTRADQRNWIGGVLGVVVRESHREGIPPLTSLVVHKHDGQVGGGYDEVLRVAGLSPINDQLEREQHAAASRLECYRRFCPSVPADARPTLTRQMQAAVDRRRLPKVQLPTSVCPRCFIHLPLAGGECPNCD